MASNVSVDTATNWFFENFVLFTDETTFCKNENLNRHNFHYYADEILALLVSTVKIDGFLTTGMESWEILSSARTFLMRSISLIFKRFQSLLKQISFHVRDRIWFIYDGASVQHSCSDQFLNFSTGKVKYINFDSNLYLLVNLLFSNCTDKVINSGIYIIIKKCNSQF